MTHFLNLTDLTDLKLTVKRVLEIKKNPFQNKGLGNRKTLAMLFFNASLRTRFSTEKAARNLGMDVITLNVNDAWQLEFEDGTVMNAHTSEHIREAAKVISQYADIIAVRAFPSLENREKDQAETILNGFKENATVPIMSMESATAHPLQGLTDMTTVSEFSTNKKPKIVLSWAPHPKALPHAVANSFIMGTQLMDYDLTITHPEGYELNPSIVKNTKVVYNQEEALKNADFVYVKNWSSYRDYGKIRNSDSNWMMTAEKLGAAKFMHCLPVRRNVVVEDAVLDGHQSLVIQQAHNRVYAAQAILEQLINCKK